MDDIDTFLAKYPPFDRLAEAELQAAARAAREVAYEPGEIVLVEDGPPAPGLWVIVTGSMDLVHEGEVVQVLEPGECFGHPSLLSGLSPSFTVRAREGSTCALIAEEAARRVLGGPPGAAYVARTMRARLTRTGYTVHGLLDVGTTPVAAIMEPARYCDGEEPVREAVRRLGSEGSTALLVVLGADELGIVADADIRAAVARDGFSLDDPVRTIARRPVVTIPPTHLAVEATIDLLAAGADHAAVRDGDGVRGVVGTRDLLELDGRSPIALRRRILAARDEPELARATAELAKLFVLLMRAGVPSGDVGRVLSLQHDAVVSRLIDFSIRDRGPAPGSWAWLDLGSAARREFTLASDQDNGFAYRDPEPERAAQVDAYFERLGADVNDGLARCGIGIDNNGVLASKRLWRMSRSDWLRTFDECLRIPDESHLIRATVSFDFRATAGGLSVAPELSDRIRAARDFPDFMRLMARSAAGFSVALGFRGQLATGRDGSPAGRLDLKRGGVIPLVNLVRYHALAAGVTISPTLDRIAAVASVGGIDADLEDALAEAFELITRLRFERHADCIAAGVAVDNLIDPGELPPIARTDLREALHVVRRAQRALGVQSRVGK